MWQLAASQVDNPFAFAATLLGLGGIAAGAWAVFRTRGTRETIDLLEQSLRIERTERLEHVRRCDEELAKLQGQVDVLVNGLGDRLAESLIRHLDERQAD